MLINCQTFSVSPDLFYLFEIIYLLRDLRPKIDPKDVTIEELKGETVGRLPGTINGTEFIIRNCEVK